MHVQAQPLTSEAFARFGSFARQPGGPPLAGDATFRFWSDAARFAIDGEAEVGYCTVFRRAEPAVDWLERHDRTPEILIPFDAPVVLPVSPDGASVEAFTVQPGEAAVIAPGVWHSACLPATGESATYFVVFRRGTPAEDVAKQAVAPVRIDF